MFHVLLHEPQIPPNTGNIIRLCANSGAHLHLIAPLGFRLDDRSLRRSGLDYHALTTLSVHADTAACIRALRGARLFAVETGSQTRYDELSYRDGDAFLFGSETRGLDARVLQAIGAHTAVRIPMRARNRSINMSNAVAIVLFEAWRQNNFSCAENPSHTANSEATARGV